MNKYTINPVSTGNQPLSVEVRFEDGIVVDARVGIRGFWEVEGLLQQKNPLDALQLTQRINSHLSVAHGVAAARAIEKAVGAKLTFNGMLCRNILESSEVIYYHIYHFYQGVLFTYALPPNGGRSQDSSRLPNNINNRLVENYWEAIHIRTRIQEMMAILAGKVPHSITIVPGGISDFIDTRKLIKLGSYLGEINRFVNEKYINDVREIVRFFPEWANASIGTDCYFAGAGLAHKLLKTGDEDNFLWRQGSSIRGNTGTGSSNQIELDSTCSWLLEDGQTDTSKENAYTWLRAARLDGAVVETGALARRIVNGEQGFIENINPSSILGRELVKAKECSDLTANIKNWLDNLEPEKPTNGYDLTMPVNGEAVGSTESAAGPAIHKVQFVKGKIDSYKIIDPIAFNYSPTDASGQRGPLEQGLVGLQVADPTHPLELVRAVRAME